MTTPLHHTVPVLPQGPALHDGFHALSWASIPALQIQHFHHKSSAHRPTVAVRLAASRTHLHCCWQVMDAQVVSKVTEPNGSVCTDSCVELFFAPKSGHGYFNLEINAGGTKHCSYIEDSRVVDGAFAKMRFLTPSDLTKIAVRSTLPPVISPEIAGPTTWEMAVAIPFEVLSDYVGQLIEPAGTWRANLYKCADLSSTPHWASWSPIGERLAFHQPEFFGSLHFT